MSKRETLNGADVAAYVLIVAFDKDWRVARQLFKPKAARGRLQATVAG